MKLTLEMSEVDVARLKRAAKRERLTVEEYIRWMLNVDDRTRKIVIDKDYIKRQLAGIARQLDDIEAEAKAKKKE